MERKDLEAKSKADLLTLGTSLGFAVTPAMKKDEIVTMLAGTPAPETLAAPPVPPAAELAALVANADDPEKAAQQAAQKAELAAKVDERRNPLPKEGTLRALDGTPVASRKVRITILATEQETGDVVLGVNGHLVQVKRGVPVVLDEAYLEVLKNSVIDTVAKNADGIVVAQKIQRYPFTAEPV